MTIWTIIPLVSCLLYIVLFYFAIQSLKNRPNSHSNKVFVYYLAMASFWSFTSFMLHLNAYPGLALFWNELLTVALIWQMVAYYQFVCSYTNKKYGVTLYIGYVFVATLAVLAFSGNIVEYSYVINGHLYHSLGESIYYIGAISAIFIFIIFFNLLKKFRKSSDPIDRNRTIYLIVGWFLVITSSYTNLLPGLDELSLDHIGNLVNAAIIAYAISRFNLLDIKYVLRHGIAYALLVLIYIGLWTGLLFFHTTILSQQPTTFIMLGSLAALVLTFTARPLRDFLQEFINRLFYGKTYSYRHLLLSFRSKMGNILDLKELAGEILPAITKAIHITHATLLFQDSTTGEFTAQFSWPSQNKELLEAINFNVDNPIITWMDKRGRPLTPNQLKLIPELKGLWQTEKDQLAKLDIGLLCPIISRNRLIGILMLGKKQHGMSYSNDDIDLIQRMAGQAGIVIENAQLYTQATLRANTDGLTDLFNHRSFHERMDQEIARSSRFGAIFSVIMLDLDLFKTYNDTYGHLSGDEVLRNIGQIMRNSIRSIDLAFRYGGEEFTVVLPETGLHDAYNVAERIRKAIEANASNRSIPITASVGVANWPQDGVMKEEIIARADAALYQAKETGRNRTCISSEIPQTATSLGKSQHGTRSRALSIIYALAATVDAKDHYTYGHSKKVSDYAVKIAEALRLPKDRIATIRAAGLLHDIGKVGVPDSILNKPGKLTPEEWEPIKTHPKLGVDILRHVMDLSSCLPDILHHHEHFDGTGYPAGLKGEAIPLEARILSIADAYEAITSPRPYREQRMPQEALEELKRCAYTQFDPQLVELFCSIIKDQIEQGIAIKSPPPDTTSIISEAELLDD